MAGPTYITVDARIMNSQDNTNVGLHENVQIEDMSYDQLAQILKAFHIITEAIKEGRSLAINGQTIHRMS